MRLVHGGPSQRPRALSPNSGEKRPRGSPGPDDDHIAREGSTLTRAAGIPGLGRAFLYLSIYPCGG
eukprot:scaffold130888_cov63-Phaeocystis_antarctica.AAC.2